MPYSATKKWEERETRFEWEFDVEAAKFIIKLYGLRRRIGFEIRVIIFFRLFINIKYSAINRETNSV